MELIIRRIGNSLGVIIPKTTLNAWGVSEGDALELSGRAIRPHQTKSAHEQLDDMRRAMAIQIVSRFPPQRIRAQILANLHRWKKQGTWGSAYEEWHQIAANSSDGEVLAVMLGSDDDAVRLRQSAPYIGLLSQDEVKKLHEEAGT